MDISAVYNYNVSLIEVFQAILCHYVSKFTVLIVNCMKREKNTCHHEGTEKITGCCHRGGG